MLIPTNTALCPHGVVSHGGTSRGCACSCFYDCGSSPQLMWEGQHRALGAPDHQVAWIGGDGGWGMDAYSNQLRQDQEKGCLTPPRFSRGSHSAYQEGGSGTTVGLTTPGCPSNAQQRSVGCATCRGATQTLRGAPLSCSPVCRPVCMPFWASLELLVFHPDPKVASISFPLKESTLLYHMGLLHANAIHEVPTPKTTPHAMIWHKKVAPHCVFDLRPCPPGGAMRTHTLFFFFFTMACTL